MWRGSVAVAAIIEFMVFGLWLRIPFADKMTVEGDSRFAQNQIIAGLRDSRHTGNRISVATIDSGCKLIESTTLALHQYPRDPLSRDGGILEIDKPRKRSRPRLAIHERELL